MLRFAIRPFEGANPVLFGMPRVQVLEVLGPPAVAGKGSDSWGKSLEICIGYDAGTVNHLGFSPGEFELRLLDDLLWAAGSKDDPNVVLLRHDPEPVERVGFLVFAKIGVTTTGFHDD